MYVNSHSCFSFRFGVMRVRELLQEAREQGVSALALTDINNTSACLDFIRQAPKYDIKPIVGVDFRNGNAQQYIGLAKNNQGFEALNEFLSKHLHAETPFPALAPKLPEVVFIYPWSNRPERRLIDSEYLGIRPQELPAFQLQQLTTEQTIALLPVTFRNKRDHNVHRLLRAIDGNTLLSKLPKTEEDPETDRFIESATLQDTFSQLPQLLENAQTLLDSCSIHFDFGTSKNKVCFTDSEENDQALLRQACTEGLPYRFPEIGPQIRERLEKELTVIQQKQFISYFLINWDIVRYAREQGYFYTGRGSGANSVAAYLLRITDVDPIELDLYFERFINLYRKSPPDFDLDFSWKDRDDVIRYIFEKYGAKHTALLATYHTFQRKAVIRELGKVFGLPPQEIDALVQAKQSGGHDQISQLVLKYSAFIQGLPSHLSVHAGGILISEKPIHAYSATTLPSKGFPLVQFSMIEAEDIGLHKFDILSQRGLGHIQEAIQLVKQHRGIDIDIHRVSEFKEDSRIKEHLRTGQTLGCFYVESPAMRMLLTKLEADTFGRLVAASSIIRPGVSKSGMMREYILRYRDPERRKMIHPVMGELMAETFGIMVYQEDVIKVAHYFAGLSLAEADILRRGMKGRYRSREEFQKVKQRFFSNCREKGYSDQTAYEVWHQIESFANYSFSKGHSASYAVESYQSLYLKAHYPLEFLVAVINNFGGFYNTEIYVHEARMRGADIQAPCVNRSRHLTCLIGQSIFLGFIHMSELQERVIAGVAEARNREGAFENLEDFIHRVPVSAEQLTLLIRIGAFRFTGKSKKELLWEAHYRTGPTKRKPLQEPAELFRMSSKPLSLPELEEGQHDDALDELEILGFSLSSPFELVEPLSGPQQSAKDFSSHVGQQACIMGYLVHVKNTRTSRGQTMHFGTFIDREGHFFDTTHFPGAATRNPFTGRGCYRLEGIVQEEFGYYTLDVHRMEKLPHVQTAETAA